MHHATNEVPAALAQPLLMCHSIIKILYFFTMMKIHNQETIIGYQRLFCKRPDCKYLLKKYYFSVT
jgi:hypothetical protein